MMSGTEDKVIRAAQGALARNVDLLDRVSRSPALEAVRSIQENSGIQRMLKDIERNRAAMRMALGPLEELRRAGLFDYNSTLARQMEQVRLGLSEFQDRFRFPEIAERARLLSKFEPEINSVMRRYQDQFSSVRLAIEGMRTPWLDVHESLRSVESFAALQGIGHALKSMPSFGPELSKALREDLGDWRDTITWPGEIFTDLNARSSFYVARGFDTGLTDFPAPAFEESLDIAELRREPPTLVDLYGEPVGTLGDADEEEGLVRTNAAHNWLLRLETQVRRFIDEQMTKAFGPDWPKHRLPNGLYDQWQDKKRKALQNGGKEWAMVAYADFTDYVLVICKKDNWAVFAPFFGRPEDVRESFQRLHPIRLDTMHARPITQDDELLLYVETRRLVQVIRGKKEGTAETQ